MEKRKEKIKNLFHWGGWKKEIWWILILLLIIFSAWAYHRDISLCREVLKEPCTYCNFELLSKNITEESDPYLINLTKKEDGEIQVLH